MISLIRYPGSKAKLVHQIIRRFPAQIQTPLWSEGTDWDYREPFFGAGSVGLEIMAVLGAGCSVWINDMDPAMVALWQTVKDRPRELMQRCSAFVPSTEAFYKFKEEDGAPMAPADMAFRKLALHRLSYSGLGAKAGGPIGGKKQGSAYNVGCRWNVQQIRRNTDRLHRMMCRFGDGLSITCGDFAPLIETATSKTFIYLDPPYYEKGGQLYKFNMDDAAHVRLRDMLMNTPATWMLSYDDHPRIRELYDGCEFEPIYATYTTAVKSGGARPKNEEVLIFRRPENPRNVQETGVINVSFFSVAKMQPPAHTMPM